MDEQVIDEILNDSFDYCIKFSNKPLGDLIRNKSKIKENTQLQLFKKVPVVKVTNILNNNQVKHNQRKTNLNFKNEKLQNQRRANKNQLNQENFKNCSKNKANVNKEYNLHQLSSNFIDENHNSSNFSGETTKSNSSDRSTNLVLESNSSNILNNLSTSNFEEFLGNIISVKSDSQNISKGVKLNIKLPATLQYMSSHMPLTIDVDLTKLNFTQCIEEHNNDKTLRTSNSHGKFLKRKKCSSSARNIKQKTNITINKTTRSNNGLKQFYENFNEVEEENISDSNSIVLSNELENTDENACQNPRIDTTSRFEFSDEIRLPVGSIITNENGNIIVSLPPNEKDDSNANIDFNKLNSSVPEKNYAVSSLLSTSTTIISNEFSYDEQISTTIQSNSTSEFPNTILKETSINMNCHEKNVDAEYGKSKEPPNSDCGAKPEYRDMPLLDDLSIDNDPTVLTPVQEKESKKKSQDDPPSVSNYKILSYNLTNRLEVDESQGTTQEEVEIIRDSKNNESSVLRGKNKYKNEDKRKLREYNVKMPELPSSNTEQDTLSINPHKVIDDFLSSAHEALDFEPDDDIISLCCSPNMFDDIEIPNGKLLEIETTKNEKMLLKEKVTTSLCCSSNTFDDIEVTNAKLLEPETSKNDKMLSKEKDEFFKEDYTNFDIFGIPRTQNKSQIKNDNNTNINKSFKIPKLSRNSSNSVNSQIMRQSSVTEIDNDPRPIRPCWPNNPTNIARPPPNYKVDLVPEISDNKNKISKTIIPQIAQVFDKPCLDYLKNSCRKGTNCRFRHTFLDRKEVKDRVLLFGEQHVISSYNFIKHHEKLFHFYFIVFCEIFTEKKQLHMLNKMIRDSVLYTEKLYYLRTLTKFLIKFGKSKHEALQLIFRILEGLPNLDNVIIDMICDEDVILYNLNILRYYLNASYKFHTATANKLAAIYLQHPNEELCKIILDVSLNTATNFPSEIAQEKNENLITFLEKCQTMNLQC